MTTAGVLDAVAQLRDAVGALLSADLSAAGGLELIELLSDVETQRRRLDAVDARLVAEVDDRRVAGDFGRASTTDLLAHRLRITPSDAKGRVDRARDLGPRRELGGAPLAPIMPATAAALGDGDISAAHTAVIAKALDDLPPELSCEAAGPAEAFLVHAARHEDPAALRRTAALVLQRLDPNGVEPRDDLIERRRDFTVHRLGDGSGVPTGRLTAETTAIWQTILDALSAPHLSPDGVRDERTVGQRRQDALHEAGLRLLRSGTLPESGGVAVTVLVTTTAADLADPAGIGRTGHGEVIGLRRLLNHNDPEVQITALSASGAILDHGRARRTASPAQRRALAARDGGCCFPGCTRPAAWTEAHHILAWLIGGQTDIDNLCLVCPFHHRLLDHRDWRVSMIDGRPHWLPPPWLDPDQRPIRNTANHLPDIDFDVGA